MMLIYDVFHHSQLISWTIHPALSNLVGFLSNRESCVLFPSPFFATTEKFLFSLRPIMFLYLIVILSYKCY